MAEPAILAPDPFADLPFPEFQAPIDGDGFAFEDFDLEDLDLDVDFDLDLFASDGQLSQPPPLATSSSSEGSPERGSSSSGAGGDGGGLRNEESSESSSRSASGTDGSGKGKGEEDEAKRRARLVRNRESAHLSRQRKKQYVEELEGKVKAMQATIADLSARISCVTAENAALKMYPLPVPWMHPAYPMRGSQVPLVPIPRLKPQQPPPAAAEPPAKKAKKTKKVASVSLLGLICLAMLCGCLIPAVNRMYDDSVDAGEGSAFGQSHHGRVLAVDNISDGIDPKPPQSASETLPALLYLPKNGKHVKINGNLVIKSIVASEKASLQLSGYDGKGPQNQNKEETSLAIPGYVTPLKAGEVMESTKGMMKNELMALAPADGNVYEDDGLLPQWFSEAMSDGNVYEADGLLPQWLSEAMSGNADGSGENQKAFPHWTSNQNRNQLGKGYKEKRGLQNGPGKSHLSAHQIKIVVASSIAVAIALIVVCYIFVLLWCKCGKRAQISVPLAQLELCRVTASRAFQYDELAAATNNFSDENKLGQGGFGPVYRGFLRDTDRHVAIKLLSAESSQGQREFEAEVNVLTQVRHRSIVQLVGWCQSDEGGLLLVYELMAQGSLDKHLYNPVRIVSWQQRYKIILDLGSALLYLHQCCDKCIVHGDIKPENVMLDASYNAKLGDFGTARLVEHGAEPRTTANVAGTIGYIDPQFVNSRQRCPEADMYSFGIALLEIASGKRPASRQPDEASALLVWVRHLYNRRMVLDAADGKMNHEFDRQQVERVLVTGLWCAHQDPSQRPSIEQAMDVLRSADAALPMLPATRDPQLVRILEEQAYGDLTAEGASVDAVAASTCYITSKEDSA